MQDKLFLSDEHLRTIENINSIDYCLLSIPLPVHSGYQGCNRTLEVYGFNIPNLKDDQDERIVLSIEQKIVDSKSEEIIASANYAWTIYSSDVTNLFDANFRNVIGQQNTYSDSGMLESSKQVEIKVPTVKYAKYLLKNRILHLADLLELYLRAFIVYKDQEINNI